MARIDHLLFMVIISVTISTCKQCAYDKCPDPWNPGSFVDHTMCSYSETSFGSECNVVKSSSLDGEEQKLILNRHNELRAQVAAGKETRGKGGGQPAGIIGALEWDTELAAIAQRWANQCSFEHDKCRDIGKIGVGQNLGYQGTEGRFANKFVDIVTSWYNEVENFDRNLVSNFASQKGVTTGHYTQLIWANTTRVGCGGVKHITRGNSYRVHLVCDYSPSGNWIGEAIYKLGDQPTEKPNNNADVEIPPPEPADQLENEPNVEISLVASSDHIDDEPNAKIPWTEPDLQSHEQSHRPYAVTGHGIPSTDEYVRDTRSHPVQPLDTFVPRIDARMEQGCRYAGCEDLKAPGEYKEHTMCQYPNANLGERCTDVQQFELDPEEKNAILNVHNQLRKQTDSDSERRGLDEGQPRANIGSLRWNSDLAEIAQRWANQCRNSRDECRDVGGNVVGQIVGTVDNEREFSPFTDLVKNWYYYLDHTEYYYPHLRWANTTDVGCGGVKYKRQDTNRKFSTQIVCNYMSQKDVHVGPLRRIDRTNSYVASLMKHAIIPSGCQYNPCEDHRIRGRYNTHTMCRYPDPGVSAECYNVQQSYLEDFEKQEIMNIINDVRRQSDDNIKEAQWNIQLAEVAQRWANQCQVGNDLCRDLGMSHVGQNIGMFGEKQGFFYRFSYIVNSWIYGPNYDPYYINGYTGQLFWANTTEVGCGGIKYADRQGYYNTYLVCNYYSPGGDPMQIPYGYHTSLGADTWWP